MATPLNINSQIELDYQKCQTIDPEGRFKSLSDEENDYAFHSQRPDDQVLVVVATGQGPRRPQVGLHLLHVHHSI